MEPVGETLVVKVGTEEPEENRKIAFTISPSNASNKRVTWSSSDPSVATVDANGVVTGVNGGYATITVKTVDGGFEATKHVVVGDILVSAHGSIQEVIDAETTTDDSVIAVAQSEYQEQLTINKPLTLLGPNAGIAGYGDRNGEAIITYPEPNADTRDKSLIRAISSDVTVKGFSFENSDVYKWETRDVDVYEELYFEGEDIVFADNRASILADKLVIRIRGPIPEETQFVNVGPYEGAVVSNNYIEGFSSTNGAVYLQGIGGTVEDNVIIAGINGIQIQPYGNEIDGVVRNNEISAYVYPIWHNYHHINGITEEHAKWVYEGNTLKPQEPRDRSLYAFPTTPYRWRAFLIMTAEPNIELVGNIFDGSNAFEDGVIKEAWASTIGLLWSNVNENSIFDIRDNVMQNVTISAVDEAGHANLKQIFANNTFPEGSVVMGNEIKVPESGKVYNQRLGDDYETIQAAVNGADDGDTILVGPGEYDVTYLEGDIFKHYLWINKSVTIKAADMNDKPVLKTKWKTGYAKGNHQQATVHITADNVTLEGLVIHDIEDYGGWLKVVEITNANNAEIRDCELKSITDDAASIYLSGSQIGKYIIENNELDGGIVPANGAGNGDGGEHSLIKGNNIGASISFTGQTNSGWDPTPFEVYPTVEENYIGGLKIDDVSRLLINSRDLNGDKLISDKLMKKIINDNNFPDGIVAVIKDVYDLYEKSTHRKRLMLNPAVYNETREIAYDTLKKAIDEAEDGNTILVGPGDYSGTLTIDKELNLIGPEEGEANVGNILLKTSAAVTIKNLNLDQINLASLNLTDEEYKFDITVDGATLNQIYLKDSDPHKSAKQSGSLVVKNSTFNNPTGNRYNVNLLAANKIDFTNNKFNATQGTGGLQYTVTGDNKDNITITGNTFSGPINVLPVTITNSVTETDVSIGDVTGNNFTGEVYMVVSVSAQSAEKLIIPKNTGLNPKNIWLSAWSGNVKFKPGTGGPIEDGWEENGTEWIFTGIQQEP